MKLCQREVAALNEYLCNTKARSKKAEPAVVDLRDLKLDERQALSNGFPLLLRSSLTLGDFREQIPVFKYLPCLISSLCLGAAATPGLGVSIGTAVSGIQPSFLFHFLPALST